MKIISCWFITNTITNLEPLKEGRTIIRNIIYHCGTCRKNHGSPFKMPKMSPWQAKKLSESVPFTYMRLDYLHSFYTKRNPSKNILICLFICVAVMAVHLEVVDDITAEQFLMAHMVYI